MSSNKVSASSIKLINSLIEDMRKFGSSKNVEREFEAAHIATMRSMAFPMSEEALRAVIYDAMFRPSHRISA